MTLGAAVRKCLRDYFTFAGRSTRSEFWKFVLFIILVLLALVVVNSLVFGPTLKTTVQLSKNASGAVSQAILQQRVYSDGVLGDIFGLAVMIPFLAAACRRMHDTGRSGWRILLPFPVAMVASISILALNTVSVPIDTAALGAGYTGPTEVRVPNGPAWLFVSLWLLCMATFVLSVFWLCQRSQPDSNMFGPTPLEATQ